MKDLLLIGKNLKCVWVIPEFSDWGESGLQTWR